MEIVNIKNINPITFEFQEYSIEDTSLISSNEIFNTFDSNTDYVEYFVYNLNQNIIFQNITGFPNFTLIDNKISIDPEADLKSTNNITGQYNTVYNFLKRRLSSNSIQKYYIETISADRTEIRLNTTSIPNSQVIFSARDFLRQIQLSQNNYLDFYLNFGNNNLVIANNILLEEDNVLDPTILIKLYEPLPEQFDLKSECWVVEKIAESKAYNINIFEKFDIESFNIPLKGPNYNISLKDQSNVTTPYINYDSVFSNTSTEGSSSLKYRLNSILEEKGIEINVDYTDYSNFINFSSALTRLENFYYKLSLIEDYNKLANTSSASNNYIISGSLVYNNKINDIITNFDGYEYYLYFESSSTSWPKTNSIPPYINHSTSSNTSINWLVSQMNIATLYDQNNNNNLTNFIPKFIIEDPLNDKYKLFIEMLGQHFDNIYLYYKDITEKYNADNRLNYGISKDLIAETLKEFGIKIYQNNFSLDNLYSALIGITPSGSLFNLPNTTTLLPAPTGKEYIKTFITASSTGSLMPIDDINKSIYKRLYHNLPLLLKKKGTVVGLKNLITSYGIPDTILRINEYGGKDKNNANDWDYWYDQYNYAYTQNGNNYITTDWDLDENWGAPGNINPPSTIAFRFKTNGLPTSSIPYSQSIFYGGDGMVIALKYTGSGYTSASYSGSTLNPYYQYAKLDFAPWASSFPNVSASVYLPFFDGEWWSVMITRNATNPGVTANFNLYVKNSIYNGYDGNQIGFQASSSVTGSDEPWFNSTQGFWGATNASGIGTLNSFSGSFQEIRYYNTRISESVFDDYVMNPNSIEGNGTNQGPNQLAFRASLGGELYTGSTSIHPKVTGSWAATQSFSNGPTSDFTFNTTPVFVSNTQSVFFDQPPVGIKNPISDKIKQQTVLLPYSSSLSNIPNNKILSPYISIQQNSPISQSYTKNINYVEVGISPQNEINDDITSQIGFFNIGEYIGDPRSVSSSAQSYSDLDTLRNEYFQKYTRNININNYIRLTKYFDNSLFKLTQDFIPARTGLASGVIIKQHLLERNKYPTPQINYENLIVSGAGIRMYTITGSNAGVFPNLNNKTSSIILPGNYSASITQVWSSTTPSISGSIAFTQSSQLEFYNGELKGSILSVTDGNLNGNNLFLNITNYNITESFIRSEYDTLINNAIDVRTSNNLMDVDYNFGDYSTLTGSAPINLVTILSGSASRAPVQDSNYTSLKSINSRYIGKQLRSAQFNTYTNNDIAYGKTLNVGNPRVYFIQFNELISTIPEWGNENIGKINANIKYIIDEQGTLIKPLSDVNGINMGNLRQAFENGRAVIQLNNPTAFGVNMNFINGTWDIHRIGQVIKPIIYTQIANYDVNGNLTGYNYTSSIRFAAGEQNPTAGTNDYRLVTKLLPNNSFNNNNIPYSMSFNSSPIQRGNSASFESNYGINVYKPTGSLAQLSGSGYVLYFNVNLIFNNYPNVIAQYALQKSTDVGSNWSNLSDVYVNHSSYNSVKINYTENSATTSSLYRISAISYLETPNLGLNEAVSLSPTSTFEVTQYPYPGNGDCTLFWETGSTRNIIVAKPNTTSSNGLNQFIGNRQKDIINSGFDPIVYDFSIQPNDEIRFEGVESLSFNITAVTQSSAGNLQLNLDRNIPSNVKLDRFLIRRYVDDLSNIIINVNKPIGGTSGGIIKPEFVTEGIEKRIKNIITAIIE